MDAKPKGFEQQMALVAYWLHEDPDPKPERFVAQVRKAKWARDDYGRILENAMTRVANEVLRAMSK